MADFFGTGNPTLAALAALGSGSLSFTGSGATTLKALSASGAGALAFTGTGASTLKPLSASGAGTFTIFGTAAVTLKALSASGSGNLSFTGAAAPTLKALTVSATGYATDYAGAAAVALPSLSSRLRGSFLKSFRIEGEPEPSMGVNAQTGTSYTIRHSDRDKLVTFDNSSPVAVAIPRARGAFGSGFQFWVQNKGSGTVTFTPDTPSKINESTTFTRTQSHGAGIWSDGVDWQVQTG
jgi:hypothetical protein